MTKINDGGPAYLAGMRRAVEICKAYRSRVDTDDDNKIGALECAIAIQDEINVSVEAARSGGQDNE